MTPAELHTRLQSLCKNPISLKLTNGSTYASASKLPGGSLQLAVHRLFLHAPTPVLEALIRFATKPDQRSRSIIRQMAHLYFTSIEPPVPSPSLANPKGKHIDLKEVYDRVNAEYFEGGIDVPITWFSAPRYRKFRHITFGMYDRTQPLIRINQILDDSAVPLFFVEFIVYHEMLHHVCKGVLDQRGRLIVHTKEFKSREKLHKFYAQSREWEKHCLTFFKKLQRVSTLSPQKELKSG